MKETVILIGLCLILSACHTFGGEVNRTYDEQGRLLSETIIGVQASLGKSEGGFLDTEGISEEGMGAVDGLIGAAGTAVNMVMPPILRGGPTRESADE